MPEETQLDRIERKLDLILEMALAGQEDEEDEASRTLDGEPAGGERDPHQPL